MNDVILWGNSYPRLELREWVYKDFNGVSGGVWYNIEGAVNICQDSYEARRASDGVLLVKGVDYWVDVANKQIKFNESGDYNFKYEELRYYYVFSSADGVNIKIMWERVVLDSLEVESGRIYEWVKGWRLKCELSLFEVGKYGAIDFMRMAWSWVGGDRRVMLFPRPNFLKGYDVVPSGDFGFDYPNGLWLGHISKLSFIGRDIVENIPPHIEV